jgi:hypothetical protein
MRRGTLQDARMRHNRGAASKTLHANNQSPNSQPQQCSQEHESTTELNKCLSRYLNSLGYCARKRHLHWLE